MHYFERDDCRFCGSTRLEEYLDLGDQPPSNSFILPEQIESEEKFPLKVSLCEDCSLSQLRGVVSGKDIFDDYQYLSSTSKALVKHYQSLTQTLKERLSLKEGDVVVDIGCNDGVMLDAHADGLTKVGIEPSEVSRFAKEKGHTVYEDFFSKEVAERVKGDRGPAKVITATNVFAHIDDIHTVVEGVKHLLDRDGVFVVETPYVVDMLEQKYFDTIYHEHLCYLGLTTISRLMERHGLAVVDVERVSIGASGPAIRVSVSHAGKAVSASVSEMLQNEKTWGISDPKRYKSFSDEVAQIRTDLKNLLDELKNSGAEIGAYGAPAKGNTLLNTFKIDSNDISAGVAETNEIKQGKLTPGSHIPIVSEEQFLKKKPAYALLLTWNYLDFFLEKSEYIKNGGRFIVPFPKPRVCPR